MKIVVMICDDGWDGVYVDGKLVCQGHGYGISLPAIEGLIEAGINIRQGFSNLPDELGEWPQSLEDIPADGEYAIEWSKHWSE